MTAPPQVSVIIPAWRAERTIAAAVSSALSQPGVPVEVIVVDDRSSDGTADVVAALAAADPRVRLIRQAENGGAGAARNRAVAEVRGDWIALLDADDAFAPGRLARLLTLAEETGASMVADNLALVTPAGRETGTAFTAAELVRIKDLTAARFIAGNHFLRYGYTLGYLKPMIRSDLARRAGRFPTHLPVAEDFHFYLDCLMAGGRWALRPEAGYSYTITPGSLSRSLSIDDVEAIRAMSLDTIAKAERLGQVDTAAALKARHRTIDLMLGHMRWVQAVKDGALPRAVRMALSRPALVPFIVKFGVEGLGKRLARLLPEPAR